MAAPIPPTDRPEFALGMRLHNEGAYYEAHEAWEDIWRDEEDDAYRLFVQGLIQVTSAFHKLTHQKEAGGASRLLARGLAKLEPYPRDYLDVELGAFRDESLACVPLIAALEGNRAGAAAFDRSKIPVLRRRDPAAGGVGTPSS